MSAARRKLPDVLLQYGTNCRRCDMPLFAGEVEVGHMVPRSIGGSDELRNLRGEHPECNRAASDTEWYSPHDTWSELLDMHYELLHVARAVEDRLDRHRILLERVKPFMADSTVRLSQAIKAPEATAEVES